MVLLARITSGGVGVPLGPPITKAVSLDRMMTWSSLGSKEKVCFTFFSGFEKVTW